MLLDIISNWKNTEIRRKNLTPWKKQLDKSSDFLQNKQPDVTQWRRRNGSDQIKQDIRTLDTRDSH